MAHPLSPSEVARAQWGAYLGLFCVGLWVTAFGPALPFIAARTGVGLGTAGLVITALAAGSISASAFVSVRLARIDTRSLVVAGLLVAACGLVVLAAAPSLPVALAATALLGLGDGLAVASTHSLVTMTAKDTTRDINRLNVFFGYGAIIGPLWAGAALEATEDVAVVFGGLAAAVVIAAAFVSRTPSPGGSPDTHLAIDLHPGALLMSAILFLYVGAEIGLGSWVASYTKEAAEASVMASAAVTSGYWGALALGRLALGRALLRHGADALLALAIAGAGAAALMLAVFGEVLAIAFAAAFVTGLAFGPIWPLAMGIGGRRGTPSTIAAMVTVGNSGSLVFPVLQGAVLASAGPTEGVIVTPVLCIAMLALVFGHSKVEKGAQEPADTMSR